MLAPGNATTCNNLGTVLNQLHKRAEAEVQFRRAIELDPKQAAPHKNLAQALHTQGQLDEALDEYRAAVALAPANDNVHSGLLYALNYHPSYNAATLLAEHKAWGARHADPLTAASAPHDNDRNPQRRLRVGYVSSHFCAHAVNFFVEPILAWHDHARCEVFCYSSVRRPDETTTRLQGYADQWRDIGRQDDATVASMIRRDRIDILVDLAGHIGGRRLMVFARKPAPVQITYIGYQNTTGMRAMDYRLTDAWSDPPGETDSYHTEKLVRLPHTFFCYLPSDDAPKFTPLPARDNGFVTFGSFNNFSKVTPGLLDTWAEILQAVPRSRLLLLAADTPRAREYVRGNFSRHGVSADRVEFFYRKPRVEYLEAIGRADIMLDTFPFNGHTTVCDTLWQGVTVVALAGSSYVSRFGSSALVSLGLEDCIAHSTAEYVRIATRLANDLGGLARERAELRDRMRRSPIVDAPQFTRELEAVYRQMWTEWCARPRGQ